MYVKHTPLSQAEQKILELFLDLDRHYFAEISKRTKLTRPRTMRALRKLTESNIFNTKDEANVKYYSLNKTPLVFAALSLVEYSKTEAFFERNKALKRGLEMFKENYKDYLIMMIFGSYVKSYATKSSDIDLLLIKNDFSKSEIKIIEDLLDILNERTRLKLSPYLMKLSEFKKKKDFVKEVIDNHILIEGGELFFKQVSE